MGSEAYGMLYNDTTLYSTKKMTPPFNIRRYPQNPTTVKPSADSSTAKFDEYAESFYKKSCNSCIFSSQCDLPNTNKAASTSAAVAAAENSNLKKQKAMANEEEDLNKYTSAVTARWIFFLNSITVIFPTFTQLKINIYILIA